MSVRVTPVPVHGSGQRGDAPCPNTADASRTWGQADASIAPAEADADAAVGADAGVGAVRGGDGAELGWGVSYGWDRVPTFEGVVAARPDAEPDADQVDGAGPGWGAARGSDAPTPLVGRFWDALAAAREGIEVMLQEVSGQRVPVSELADATVALHELDCQVRAAHSAAVQATVAAGGVPVWAATATAWLCDTHRLDSGRAASAVRNAAWLAEHEQTRVAFETGVIGFDHVTAIRRVADATVRRRAAYREMETKLVAAAGHSNPARTAQILKWWSDAVDATDADDDADASYEKRRLFLSPVGDGWDIRGYLPAAEGAELAGILNAFMEKNRNRTSDAPNTDGDADRDADGADRARRRDGRGAEGDQGDGGDGDGAGGADCGRDADGADVPPSEPDQGVPSVAQRRADALMDLARAAAAAGLTGGARSAAKVTIIIPGHRLDDTIPAGPGGTTGAGSAVDAGAPVGPADPDAPAEPGVPAGAPGGYGPVPWFDRPEAHACSWAVGNGPGSGFLAMTDALRLTCDANLTRLVLDPQSRPLDIGRTTRVIPPWIRKALDVRDGGCVICRGDRPPAWCEAHHLQHWSQGGPTALSNLVLLCSKHHHDLHKGLWTITMHNGHPHVTRGPGPGVITGTHSYPRRQ